MCWSSPVPSDAVTAGIPQRDRRVVRAASARSSCRSCPADPVSRVRRYEMSSRKLPNSSWSSVTVISSRFGRRTVLSKTATARPLVLLSAPNSPPTYFSPSHAALPGWKFRSPLRSFQAYDLIDVGVRIGRRAGADLIQIPAPRRLDGGLAVAEQIEGAGDARRPVVPQRIVVHGVEVLPHGVVLHDTVDGDALEQQTVGEEPARRRRLRRQVAFDPFPADAAGDIEAAARVPSPARRAPCS